MSVWIAFGLGCLLMFLLMTAVLLTYLDHYDQWVKRVTGRSIIDERERS